MIGPGRPGSHRLRRLVRPVEGIPPTRGGGTQRANPADRRDESTINYVTKYFSKERPRRTRRTVATTVESSRRPSRSWRRRTRFRGLAGPRRDVGAFRNSSGGYRGRESVGGAFYGGNVRVRLRRRPGATDTALLGQVLVDVTTGATTQNFFVSLGDTGSNLRSLVFSLSPRRSRRSRPRRCRRSASRRDADRIPISG